jgi:methionine aminopeptidase
LTGIIGQCLAGAKIIDVCEFGTAVINAQTAKLFTKKVNGQAVDRGVAFPVCISVNDIVCNCSPLATEEMVSDNGQRFIVLAGWLVGGRLVGKQQRQQQTHSCLVDTSTP